MTFTINFKNKIFKINFITVLLFEIIRYTENFLEEIINLKAIWNLETI